MAFHSHVSDRYIHLSVKALIPGKSFPAETNRACVCVCVCVREREREFGSNERFVGERVMRSHSSCISEKRMSLPFFGLPSNNSKLAPPTVDI